MVPHLSNSDCTQRNALHETCSDLVTEAVRHVRRSCSRAHQHDFAELEQIGHIALLEAASRNRDDATFRAFAWKGITGQIRRFVAQMQLGHDHRRLEKSGIHVSVITNISQWGDFERLTPPAGGNAHWVRDTVDHPPSSVCAMFLSAGYSVSGRPQERRLMRRLSRMVV